MYFHLMTELKIFEIPECLQFTIEISYWNPVQFFLDKSTMKIPNLEKFSKDEEL